MEQRKVDVCSRPQYKLAIDAFFASKGVEHHGGGVRSSRSV
jgi:hypothetical protein